MNRLIQDVRYALRQMAKSPGFAAVAVLTLALGIGANTAIFSLLDSVLLRTLPVAHAEQIVALSRFSPSGEGDSFTYPQFEQLSSADQVFSHVFGFAYRSVRVGSAGRAENAVAQLASGQYFDALGVPAAVGRTLSPEDQRSSGDRPAAVISYRYWQQRFAADPSIVGRSLTVAGSQVTVVGVMPPDFYGTSLDYSTDLWLPITMQPQMDGGASTLESAGINWVVVMARLKPGVSVVQAGSAANLMFQRDLRSQHADSKLLEQRIQVEAGGRPVSGLRQAMSAPLMILMTIVGLVLLLACTNIANLLLAKGVARRREITVRLAMGAGRRRVIQQLLTESVLLAALGGAAGMVFAIWGASALLDFVAKATNQPAPAQLQFHADFGVLSFLAFVSMLAGILFGLAPALNATRRVDLVSGLKDGRGGGISPRMRLNRLLLISQVAICLPLLVAAGLFIRSFQRLAKIDLGFDAANVIQIKCLASGSSYTPIQFDNAWKQILTKIQATPGVLSASASLPGLFSHSTYQTVAFVGDEQVTVHTIEATPGFFATLQIPLLRGRDFSSADNSKLRPVAIVNQALARRLTSNSNLIGERLRSGFGPTPLEIIGVAKDTQYDNVLTEVAPTIFVPLAQFDLTPSFRVFDVRTATDPATAAATFRQIIQSVDSSLPAEIRPLNDSIGESLLIQHLIARVTGFFGVLSLLLSYIGLYGLMSYLSTQRTSEIGIRMAFGADRLAVVRLVMGEAVALVLVGAGIGLTISMVASRLVGSQLFGLTATDPTSFAAATALMLAVAAVASYLPARRASQVDPLVALRYE